MNIANACCEHLGVSGVVMNSEGEVLRDATLKIALSNGATEIGKISKNSGRFVHLLSEGLHTIEVSQDGYDIEKSEVFISFGSFTKVEIVLSKSSYTDGNSHSSESTIELQTSSSETSSTIYPMDYFYYPRKIFQDIKKSHPKFFDVYR